MRYVVFAIVVWNLLFIPVFLELLVFSKNEIPPTIFYFPPIVFAFLASLVLIISSKVRYRILKEGKTIRDIKKDCFMMLGLSGLCLKNLLLFNRNWKIIAHCVCKS